MISAKLLIPLVGWWYCQTEHPELWANLCTREKIFYFSENVLLYFVVGLFSYVASFWMLVSIMFVLYVVVGVGEYYIIRKFGDKFPEVLG